MQIRINNKPKLLVHKILKNSSKYILIDKLKCTNYKCKEDTYPLKANNYILCEDGAKINLYKCYKCNKSLWNCPTSSKNKNFYKDSKVIHHYERIYYKIKINQLKDQIMINI